MQFSVVPLSFISIKSPVFEIIIPTPPLCPNFNFYNYPINNNNDLNIYSNIITPKELEVLENTKTWNDLIIHKHGTSN